MIVEGAKVAYSVCVSHFPHQSVRKASVLCSNNVVNCKGKEVTGEH